MKSMERYFLKESKDFFPRNRPTGEQQRLEKGRVQLEHVKRAIGGYNFRQGGQSY